jgi:hypothetical protein
VVKKCHKAEIGSVQSRPTDEECAVDGFADGRHVSRRCNVA